jgi:hypothetical protein
MDKEQLETFKTQLSLAIEAHLANGGKLISGSFGYGKCLCPIACLVNEPELPTKFEMAFSRKYEKAVSEKLGFEVSANDMWDFIGAFDDEDKLTINEVMVIGIELRKKYLTKTNE